jgi:hypothetical protein
MNDYVPWDDLVGLAQVIVHDALALKNAHVPDHPVTVSYCCVFSRDDPEFDKWTSAAGARGAVAKDTPTGPVFVVPEINTAAGPLRVLKIRKPDATRGERGDADFRLEQYEDFKRAYLGRPGFNLIERSEFEMVELVDSQFDARAYFSNPPVETHAGIREALAG